MRGGPQTLMPQTASSSMPFAFNPEEVEVARYTPRFSLFLQRSAILSGATLIAFCFLPLFDLSLIQRIGIALLLVATYTVVFEEWRDWQDQAGTVWVQTNQRLIRLTPDEDDGPAWLNLQDIQSVRPWFWWSVRLRLTNGRAMVMAYVGPVKTVANAIKKASDAAKEGAYV